MLTEIQKEKAVEVLLREIPKYITSTDKFALSKFTNNKIKLEDLGICNGVSKLIDIELQKINKGICILSHDTIGKFKEDLQYVDRVFVTEYKPLKSKRIKR